jgi:hypothetical protein
MDTKRYEPQNVSLAVMRRLILLKIAYISIILCPIFKIDGLMRR